MKKSELIEILVNAENERDLLFLENSRLKEEIQELKRRLAELEQRE